MHPRIIMLALAVSMSAPAFAEDIQPGLWELTLEARVAASPEFAPAPYSVNECLTAQDAQDPSRVLAGVANSGASDCTYTDKNFSGNTFRFKMQCAGSLGMKTQGEIIYSATSMEGSILSTANLMGQTTEIQSKFKARRLGEC